VQRVTFVVPCQHQCRVVAAVCISIGPSLCGTARIGGANGKSRPTIDYVWSLSSSSSWFVVHRGATTILCTRSGTAMKTARVLLVAETNEIENGLGAGGR
jgi:hypothetical protein